MSETFDKALLKSVLQHHGLLGAAEEIQVDYLGGGVSNHVLQVVTPRQTMVIKQSLPKLRVAMDWYADQSRIWRERDYLQWVGEFLPANVPPVIFSDDEHYLLGMRAIPNSVMWKKPLLDGVCNFTVVEHCATLLAQIHSYTYQNPARAATFQRKMPRTQDSFEQLRVDPYWRTIARRHPDLAGPINAIIDTMEANEVALVHGDYSPKNILVPVGSALDQAAQPAAQAVVILDAEVAHWGDPTFDVAFCINHLLLKAVYHHPKHADFMTGAAAFWQHYQRTVQPSALAESVAARLPGQLAALFLARVDGKSPVEYLVGDEVRQSLVRAAARAMLALYPNLTLAQTFDEVQRRL